MTLFESLFGCEEYTRYDVTCNAFFPLLLPIPLLLTITHYLRWMTMDDGGYSNNY